MRLGAGRSTLNIVIKKNMKIIEKNIGIIILQNVAMPNLNGPVGSGAYCGAKLNPEHDCAEHVSGISLCVEAFLLYTSKMVRKTRKARLPGSYQCHPRVTGRKKGQGCLPVDVYNRVAGGGGSQDGGRMAARRRTSVKQAREKALKKTGCLTDRCILEKSGLSREEIDIAEKKFLRPKMPDDWKGDPDKWLDTTNIEKVLKQYEDVREDFKFVGAIPIDFSAPDPYAAGTEKGKKCLYDETCKMNLDNLKGKGKKYIGFVFNLDPHFKNGSHWVSMVLDLARKECNFFDSYGYEPHPLISRLMKSFKMQDPSLNLNYNARRFQFGESECGMYSIYFITTMLDGERFKKFVKKGVPDSEMNKLREWVFSS